MGLDISSYRNVRKVGELKSDEDYDLGVVAFVNKDFPDQADDLVDKGIYEGESGIGFRAGSYSGYNWWRDHLCLMARGVSASQFWNSGSPEGPFTELINFSDCEGVIGPKTSQKLFKDFQDFKEKAQEYSTTIVQGDLFLSLYEDWSEAFWTASQNGFVDFH